MAIRGFQANRFWNRPLRSFHACASPPRQLESKIWSPTRTFFHLSQFTRLNLESISIFPGINLLSLRLLTSFRVNLRSREIPIGLALTNCSYTASYLGTKYSFQYKTHHDSALLYIIIPSLSHTQWNTRLRWSGARSRQHFGRYTWRRI